MLAIIRLILRPVVLVIMPVIMLLIMESGPLLIGHGGVSRSTYPTPRTVWISRGSPSASVLRRR